MFDYSAIYIGCCSSVESIIFAFDDVNVPHKTSLIVCPYDSLRSLRAAYWTLEPDEIVAINKKVNDWEIYPVYVDALKKVWIEE